MNREEGRAVTSKLLRRTVDAARLLGAALAGALLPVSAAAAATTPTPRRRRRLRPAPVTPAAGARPASA